MKPLTIYITDDDVAVRDALTTLLSLEGHRCIPIADGNLALEAVARETPDLLLLDLKMPGLSGLEVLQQLPKPLPFACLMISAHGDIRAAVEAIRSGATDFLEKPIEPDVLLETIKNAVEAHAATPAAAEALPNLDVLTIREQEVASALCQGNSNKEVARLLDLSPRTIEAHRARIYEKMKVKNLASLIRATA